MSHENLHESKENLKSKTLDMHRAIQSLMEELEAIDWYGQRVDACTDQELKKILIHNRDEEKEHDVMLIEWLSRNDSFFEDELKNRLFKTGPIANAED
jgi:ferritin-like protein